MQDTFFRYYDMLQLIPRYPQTIDTERIKTLLEECQHSITLRSIQRDLHKLSVVFMLENDNARPQGWYWSPNAKQFTLPALDPQAALTLHMVSQHITSLLPASTVIHLQPWFKAAEGILASHGNGLSKWSNKVRVIPKGFPRIPPAVDAVAQTAVTQAVLMERQLELTYLANGATEPWTRVIHPLAIVVRDQVIYLLCTFTGHKDVRQLVLHRIQAANVLESPALRPANFDLDAYIASGKMGITQGHDKLKLEAYFAPHLAIHLDESPISTDQKLDEVDKEIRLRATVPDTLELRLWLKSFGDEVFVTRPASLRREFRQMAENLASFYADDSSE